MGDDHFGFQKGAMQFLFFSFFLFSSNFYSFFFKEIVKLHYLINDLANLERYVPTY